MHERARHHSWCGEVATLPGDELLLGWAKLQGWDILPLILLNVSAWQHTQPLSRPSARAERK